PVNLTPATVGIEGHIEKRTHMHQSKNREQSPVLHPPEAANCSQIHRCVSNQKVARFCLPLPGVRIPHELHRPLGPGKQSELCGDQVNTSNNPISIYFG